MFSHVKALIGGVNDERVFKETILPKVIDDPSHIAIDRMNHPHVVVHIALVFPFGQCFSRQSGLLELANNGLVMAVPLIPLRGGQVQGGGPTRLLKTSVGMTLILPISQFVVINTSHILL